MRPPNAGKGRPKGSVNKFSSDVKGMTLEALHHLGGAEWLFVLGLENPAAFSRLVAKMFPTQVTGEGGGPIQVANDVTITDETASDVRIAQLMAVAMRRRDAGEKPREGS